MLIFRKIAGNRIFISNLLHDKKIFFLNCNFIPRVDARSTLAIKTNLEFVYKYDFVKRIFIVPPEKDDFILPKWRFPTGQIPLAHVKLEMVNKKIPQKIQKIIKPADGISSDKKRDINIGKNIKDEY